ncbi:MAG: hypothetical protein QXK01_08900 [Thermofilum sp.]|uniref:hypothetical protein n=1 Tax=Thermofilum sp. TaxID=1961369 RepID=UPI00316AB5EC
MSIARTLYWYGPVGILWLFEELWEDALWMNQQLTGFKRAPVETDLTPYMSPVTVRIVDASYEAGHYTVTFEAAWRGFPLTPLGPYVEELPALIPAEHWLKHIRVDILLKWEGGETTASLYVKKFGSDRVTVRIPKPFSYIKVTVLEIREMRKEDWERLGIAGLMVTGAIAVGAAAAAAAAAGVGAAEIAAAAAKIKAVLTPLAEKAGALAFLDPIAQKIAEFIVRVQGYPIERLTYWLKVSELVPIIEKLIAAGALTGAAAAAAAALIEAAKGEVQQQEAATLTAAKAEAEWKETAGGGAPPAKEKFAIT